MHLFPLLGPRLPCSLLCGSILGAAPSTVLAATWPSENKFCKLLRILCPVLNFGGAGFVWSSCGGDRLVVAADTLGGWIT